MASVSVMITSTGQNNFKGQINFTGVVNKSLEGTAVIRFTLMGNLEGSPGSPVSSAQGELVVGDGSEGLANLHGQGTIQVSLGEPTSYSVFMHFDPA